MYTHILVPVDGSATSSRGLHQAIRLGQLTGGRRRLVHVMEDPIYGTGLSGIGAAAHDAMADLVTGGHALLAASEAHARAGSVEVDVDLFARKAGRVCEVVVEAATTCRADLIVLGTHGRRGIRRAVLCSDAEQILRLAPVPVLLVRDFAAA